MIPKLGDADLKEHLQRHIEINVITHDIYKSGPVQSLLLSPNTLSRLD